MSEVWNKAKSWIYNEKATLLFSIIFAITLGIIFSPWSYGLIYYMVSIIIWEILFGLATGFQYPYWNPIERIAIFFSGFLGWIVGRTVVGIGPFSSRREQINFHRKR